MSLNEPERGRLLEELERFGDELLRYRGLAVAKANRELTKKQEAEFQRLRLGLQQVYGSLETVIEEYGGRAVLPISGKKYAAFSLALGYPNVTQHTITALDGAINMVNKALGKLRSPALLSQVPLLENSAQMANFLFDKMEFHPKVVEASQSLFETGHYAQAIFEAFKAVNNFVKEKTGLSLDGKNLMAQVFSETNPVIKLNKLRTQSERDEQEGFKFLFMGAMVGIRNPKAHDNVGQTDPYRTLEYLSFASLLMKRIEEGKLTKSEEPNVPNIQSLSHRFGADNNRSGGRV